MPHPAITFGIPLLLGGLATAGWWVWRERRLRGAAPASSGGIADLDNRDFEALVTRAFERQGYQRIDGGPRARTLTLRRDRETYLVDSRHRHLAKVGVEAVQALHRELAAQGANGGFVLTHGRFSREATTFAAACNLRLLEGPALRGLLEPALADRRHGA